MSPISYDPRAASRQSEAAPHSVKHVAEARRTLAQALAHYIMGSRLNSERMILANRIAATLRPGESLALKGELHKCRAAKRGETLAEVH